MSEPKYDLLLSNLQWLEEQTIPVHETEGERTLLGKTALLTGASGGIGLETARLLAARGANLLLQGFRNPSMLQDLREELQRVYPQQKIHCIQSDLRTMEGVQKVLEASRHLDTPPTIFVHAAGTAQIGLVNDLTEEQFDELQALHLRAPLFLAQGLFPLFLQNHWGRVVLVSSIWGLVGASCEVAYSTVKAGLIGMTRALAKEWGPSGITVNSVAPGVIDTPMNEALDATARAILLEETPVGRFGTGMDVARAIGFFCEPGSDFVTGQVLSPNGGMVI